MACFGGSGHVNASYRWIQERGGEKSMLTNSMRELISSWSPGAGELHFLPKLLVQEVARNCELELLPNRPIDNFGRIDGYDMNFDVPARAED